ncbi:MAG: hypothetical protein KJ938_01355 [Actinobacteria bacterium]|nr:hypothetical protein [Actinomycetota bacterium]
MVTPDPRAAWQRVVVTVWSLVLALLLLGPALAPGYVLSYDMVWVRDLAVRADVLGLGSGLPRAVPSDAWVAVLDELVPGMLLQKLVLVGVLLGGTAGIDRLLPRVGLVARLAAVTLWQWNPYVVERLVLGHWPVLVGYAALPWVLLGALRWRATGRAPWWLLLAVLMGSLSVSAGLATSLALLVVLLVGPGGRRPWGRGLLLAGAAQAPWLVSGLLHVRDAVTDPAAARLFALSDEGPLPGPLAALTLGGVWNAEVVPVSRTGPATLVALVVLAALLVLGIAVVRRRGTEAAVPWTPLVLLWAVGWVLAILTWLAPGPFGVLAAVVPGGGVLRDGSRLLVLCVPLLVALVAVAVDAAWDWSGARWPLAARVSLAVVVVVWPVTVLPDGAWGAGGRLGAVDYPAAYAAARSALGDAPGDVLVLPLSSYRQPEWNDGRKVLDPLGRVLVPVPVASDELVVDDVVIAGEDPRVRRVRAALESPTPQARAAALGALGVGAVATDLTAPGPAPDIAGALVHDDDALRVVRLAVVDESVPPRPWYLAMGPAWTLHLGVLLVSVVGGVRCARQRFRRNLSG